LTNYMVSELARGQGGTGVPPVTIRQHGRDRPCPLEKPSQAALLLRLQLHGYG